jgi:alpha-galactosidase
MIRVEQPNDSVFVHGVVSQDKAKGIFAYVTVRAQQGSQPGTFQLPGLDPKATYKVNLARPAGDPKVILRALPHWLDGVQLTGAALAKVGLRAPILAPENAILIEVERI